MLQNPEAMHEFDVSVRFAVLSVCYLSKPGVSFVLVKYLGGGAALLFPFPSLSLSPSVPFTPKALSIPAFSSPSPKSSWEVWGALLATPAGSGAEPRSQTHFDAFTALKMHLVAQLLSRLYATQMTVF